MRRPILYFLLSLFLIYSCKKDHSAAMHPAQKMYRVTFNASGFTQQVTGSVKGKQVNSLHTNGTGAGYDVNGFTYLVYNSQSNNMLHQISQKAGTDGWGTVIDSLPPGTYDIYFMAYNNYYTGVDAANKNLYLISTVPPWNDLYFKKLSSFTVSNQAINQAVSLERIVGEVTFKLLDTLPANASQANVSVSSDYHMYNFDTGPTGTLKPAADWITRVTTTRTNFSAGTFVMNTAPISASITLYTSTGAQLGHASVDSISVIPNRQTILTGYIFGANTGVNPTLGQAWGPPVSEGF